MAGNVGQTLQDIDSFENAEPAPKGLTGSSLPPLAGLVRMAAPPAPTFAAAGSARSGAVAHRPVGSAGAGMCAARGFR